MFERNIVPDSHEEANAGRPWGATGGHGRALDIRNLEGEHTVPDSHEEANVGRPREATGGHWTSVTLRATKQYLTAPRNTGSLEIRN